LVHFALRLENFDADEIASQMKKHGIEMGDVVSRFGAEDNGPSVYITDPDGNTVESKGPPEV